MHELTEILFKELEKCKTQGEFMNILGTNHKKNKSELASTGLIFEEINTPFSESIRGNQIISGDNNISKAFFYEELNYINYGLTIEWYSRIDNTDRYSNIQNRTKDLWSKLS